MEVRSEAAFEGCARFVELIGMEGTRKLLKAYGGETLELPSCRRLKRVRRDNEILKLHRAGVSSTVIGRRFKISTRAVRIIIARGWAFDAEDYELFMPASFCELAECIGPEAAEKLCDAMGGGERRFPELETLEDMINKEANEAQAMRGSI